MQAARYNSLLNAPYIILTNGLDDLIFEVVNGKASPTDYPFNVFQEPAARGLDYWQKRGCCSEVIQPLLKKRMERLQSVFWTEDGSTRIHYLSFNESFLPVPMDHYYRIFLAGEDKKLAVTLVGYGSSANYITAVLNSKGVNRGVCVINLDELAAGRKGSIQLFLQNREILVESAELKELILNGEFSNFNKTLVNILLSFFD
jgi:hypothetical protein